MKDSVLKTIDYSSTYTASIDPRNTNRLDRISTRDLLALLLEEVRV
jgi:hypothetical protein